MHAQVRFAALAAVAALALASGLGAGCARTAGQASKGESAPGAALAQVQRMTVDGEGFHPNKIVARAGQPITLEITRTTDATCANQILIPGLDVKRDLPLNQAVAIKLTPDKKGTVEFACGMNMFKGTIVVE